MLDFLYKYLRNLRDGNFGSEEHWPLFAGLPSSTFVFLSLLRNSWVRMVFFEAEFIAESNNIIVILLLRACHLVNLKMMIMNSNKPLNVGLPRPAKSGQCSSDPKFPSWMFPKYFFRKSSLDHLVKTYIFLIIGTHIAVYRGSTLPKKSIQGQG